MPMLLPDNSASPKHFTHGAGDASAGYRVHVAARGFVANG